jgi:hypothetical protein
LLLRRLSHFAAMDAGMKGLVIEAAVLLAVSRIALRAIPFRRLSPYLGRFVPPDDPRVGLCREPADARSVETARRVRRAVNSASRHVPFEAVCLPQAMAAQAMLRRRGIACAMHFGARKGEAQALDAHAWLDAAGVPVTGYPLDAKLTEIACYV